MNFRILAALLAGIATGYLLGTAGPPSGRRVERSDSEARQGRESAPSGALEPGHSHRSRPGAAEALGSRSRERAAPAVEAAPEIDPQLGELIIDVRVRGGESPGRPGGDEMFVPDVSQWFHLVALNMKGIEYELPLEDLGGRFRIVAEPGAYALHYHDGRDFRKRGVTIAAGKRTTIRFPQLAKLPPPPIPPGRGRLRVRLVGPAGGPVGDCDVVVAGRLGNEWQRETFRSRSDGVAVIDIRSGRYELHVGGAREAVEVRAGVATPCLVDHATTGAVVLPDRSPERIVLARPASIPAGEPFAVEITGWGKSRLAFVTAGEYGYGFRINGSNGPPWPAGRLVVEPGRTTRVEPRLPRGSLAVVVRMPAEDGAEAKVWASLRRLPVEDGYRAPVHFEDEGGGVKRGEVRWLPPGRWRITVGCKGRRSVVREFDVANRGVDVEVTLRR